MDKKQGYNQQTDLEIFEKVSNYDSRALEELYNRYSPILFTLIKKIAPDEKTAEEILTEVFAITWRKSDKFDIQKDNVYTWLVHLARNKAVDTIRRTRAPEHFNSAYDDEFEDMYIIPKLLGEPEICDLSQAFAKKTEMEANLTRLSDTQKYILHLSFFEGYTSNEISRKMQIPDELVRTKLKSAIESIVNNTPIT